MADLKHVYAAVDEQTALNELDRFEEIWGKKYPKIGRPWRENLGRAEHLFQVSRRDPPNHLYDQRH